MMSRDGGPKLSSTESNVRRLRFRRAPSLICSAMYLASSSAMSEAYPSRSVVSRLLTYQTAFPGVMRSVRPTVLSSSHSSIVPTGISWLREIAFATSMSVRRSDLLS